MRVIDFINLVSRDKNPDIRILKKFIDNKSGFSLYDFQKKQKEYHYFIRRLLPVLMSFGVIVDEEYKWKTGLHKQEISGIRYKINQKNKIVKILMSEI